MSIINRGYITSFLRPGLNTVFANFNTYPDLWKEIYSQHLSEKAVEYDVSFKELDLAQLRGEGAPTAMGDMRELYTTSYLHAAYAIGFQITRFAIEDNLYKEQFPQQALNMRQSLATVKNVNGAYLFNNGFNANSTGGDGQPLYSTAHPTTVGTLANTFTNAVGLNEVSLQSAITIVKGWTNNAGWKINTNTIKLLVPQNMTYEASRLLNSAYTPNSGDNAINPLNYDKWMPGGVCTNQFILNPNFWAILTDEPNGFKYFSRTKPDIDFITDTMTDNVTVRMMERYSMNYSNWRCSFGAIGLGA